MLPFYTSVRGVGASVTIILPAIVFKVKFFLLICSNVCSNQCFDVSLFVSYVFQLCQNIRVGFQIQLHADLRCVCFVVLLLRCIFNNLCFSGFLFHLHFYFHVFPPFDLFHFSKCRAAVVEARRFRTYLRFLSSSNSLVSLITQYRVTILQHNVHRLTIKLIIALRNDGWYYHLRRGFRPSELFGLLAVSGGLEHDYRCCKFNNRYYQVYQAF